MSGISFSINKHTLESRINKPIFSKISNDVLLHTLTFLDEDSLKSLQITSKLGFMLIQKRLEIDATLLSKHLQYPITHSSANFAVYIWKKTVLDMQHARQSDSTLQIPTLIHKYHLNNIKKINDDIIPNFKAQNTLNFLKDTIDMDAFDVEISPGITAKSKAINFLKSLNKLDNIQKLQLFSEFFENLCKTHPDIVNQIIFLELSSFNLIEIPTCIHLFRNIKFLDLSHNNIKELPPEITYLTNLNSFRLDYNLFEKIPAYIFYLTQLIRLDFSYNYIKIIPSQIKNLTSLVRFEINNNEIEYISPEIKNLTQLAVLNLCFNKIKNIPHDVGGLYQLVTLNLSDNYLESVPNSIFNLTNLKCLNLLNNNLRTPPF